MLKRILLALDETPSSAAARQLAVSLAASHGASVTGLSVIDVPYHTAGEATPMGASAYKREKDAHAITESKKRATALSGLLTRECAAQEVPHNVSSVEADPSAALIAAAETHDIIVIGHDSSFHGERDEGIVATTRRLVQSNPRPVIVTPDTLSGGEAAVVLYDGSLPSMRALQMFMLLGIHSDKPVNILSVDPSEAKAREAGGGAEAYLKAHGRAARVFAVASSAHPADVLAAEAKVLSPAMLVMGAFGHAGLREFFFGSTTDRLLRERPAPLFVHH